jgi:hypothetical protein
MRGYILAIAVTTLLLALTIVENVNAQATWYPGKGAEQGTYFIYALKDLEYEGGRQLTVAIWLEGKDQSGNWVSVVSVNDQGIVSTGKMVLSGINMQPISAEPSVSKFRDVIKRTLTWLGDYATSEDPKPLAQVAWGRLGITGGVPIGVGIPASVDVVNEQITAAGVTWNTTIVGFKYSETSKIWVAENFPLPIKAKVYSFRTEHPIPVQYEFTLQEFGRSDKPIELKGGPIELPKSPLRKLSDGGSVFIELYWAPEVIMPGQEVKFAASLYDNANRRLKDTERYTIEIFDDGKSILKQELSNNLNPVTVTFSSEGVKKVVVSYETLFRTGDATVTRIEKAEFNMVVVPEFPLGVIAVIGSVMAMMLVIARIKMKSVIPSFR